MDGRSHFTFFFKVALPLSKALVSVIGLYYLVGHWNDFFTALIYIRDTKLQPAQIVLRDILLSNQVFSSGAGTGGDAGVCATICRPDQVRGHYCIDASDSAHLSVYAKIFRERRHDRLH